MTFHLKLTAYNSEDATENILPSGVWTPFQKLVSVHKPQRGGRLNLFYRARYEPYSEL